MRAGSCAIQQALTTEAAAVLKHSLNLARRRGHAQVTPLHVAATLLNSSSSASSLLRRACVRSHPHPPTSLPLQCRALELCFNVALNRLPNSPPSSSSALLAPLPSLSNALIAALKRAQAHQRRGCIESHNTHCLPPSNANQPLLAIKVELEQLIISILDDPSVSRVMKEAGFSSTSVKQNLEDGNNAVLFPTTQFAKKEEDVRVLLDVMMRRKRTSNAVVVGDSASLAESVVNELLTMVDRGEVPEELRGAQVIKLHLSYVPLRLMNKRDVEMKISEVRRRIFSSLEKGVVIYAGDLKWAVDEEDGDGVALAEFRPAEYFISEIERVLLELKSVIGGRGMVWVLAFSSYQTYMKCKMMNPCVESQWGLQAVLVPAGGLALSLHAPPSGMDSVMPKVKMYQHHYQIFEHNRPFNVEEEERLFCCAECTANYEKDIAAVLKLETKESISRNSHLPCWLQNTKREKLFKANLFELRKKWNRQCRSLHLHPLIGKTCQWWSNNLPSTKNKFFLEQSSSPCENPKICRNPIVTTLALCSPVFTDTATSTDNKKASFLSFRDLSKKLQENIPWQSGMIQLLVDVLTDCTSSEKNGKWIMIHGNDLIAKRRLARVLAESYGSTERVLHINLRRRAQGGCIDLLKSAVEKKSKCVVLIEGIECANPEFVKFIKNGIKIGCFVDSCGREVCLANWIFILTSSASIENVKIDEDCDRVLKMRMRIEEEHSLVFDEKRKSEWYPTRIKKKLRAGDGGTFDLNVAIVGDGEGEEEGTLSDLTHEVGDGGEEVRLPATAVFNFDTNAEVIDRIAEGFTARLQRAFDDAVARKGEDGRLVVEHGLAEELTTASGFFLEGEFDRWVSEVLNICIPTVKKGGKVRLEMEGKEGNSVEFGFLGSALPKKIFVN